MLLARHRGLAVGVSCVALVVAFVAAIALGSVSIILFWPKRLARRVPGSIVAVVLGTALVSLFRFPVETIGTRFGGIPQSLPGLHLPPMSWAH